MRRILLIAAMLTSSASWAEAEMEMDMHKPDMGMHEPMQWMIRADQLEYREGNGSALEGDLWLGGDLNKLWFKGRVEREDSRSEEVELQALYSRAVAPYWDLQIGVRHDFAPGPSRNWAAIGFQGLAPYFFEVDTALFIGESGDTALRFSAEYELLLTQRLILTPEIELNFYGQNDPSRETGSGLSNMEAGLRLRYEIRREFAPYIGVHRERTFGNTADFVRADGHSTSETTLVIGVRAWY